MLGRQASRNLLSFRLNRLSFRSLSSIPQASESFALPPPPTVDSYKFESTFYNKTAQSLYDVQEGGYVDVDYEHAKKTLPEGFAGEVEEEFEFTNDKKWMVRDSSKLLCRLVDEFESSSSGGSSAVPSLGLYGSVDLPGLTDRPEWDSAKLQVSFYGKDISHNAKPQISNNMAIVKGPGSSVENILENLKKETAANTHHQSPTKIMLTGARGVGKSIALNQMVLHARSKGWLVLFVPDGWDQVQSGLSVVPAAAIGDRTIFDNHIMSASTLRGFFKAHREQLAKIPIKKREALHKYAPILARFKEEWTRASGVPGRENLTFLQQREIVEDEDSIEVENELDEIVLKNFEFSKFNPKTLLDLLTLGVAFRSVAGLVVMDLVEELKNIEDMRVMIAVDQFNTWDAKSAYSYRDKPLVGHDICVPFSLRGLSLKKADSEKWKLKNGLFVCATSGKHGEGKKITFENQKSSIPLLIKIPAFSQVEFLSAVNRYIHQGCIQTGVNLQELATYRTCTDSNPRLARTNAVSFFLPMQTNQILGDFMNPAILKALEAGLPPPGPEVEAPFKPFWERQQEKFFTDDDEDDDDEVVKEK